jgi:Popeye protein conserved region
MVVFIHIANAIYLCSYLVKDILWLRILSVTAGLTLLGYYAWLPMPLWAAIGWSIVFVAINAWQIRLLLVERRPVTLRPHEQLLYKLAFRQLTEREFAKLIAVGQWNELGAGERIVRSGEALDQLTVLVSGRVHVEVEGKPIAELRAGCLLGDLSFIAGKVPNGDVVTMEPTRIVTWQHEVLRKLLRTNAELRAAVEQVIGEDLIAKLQTAQAGRASAERSPCSSGRVGAW